MPNSPVMHNAITLRKVELADTTQIAQIESVITPSPWAEETLKNTIAVGYLGWVLDYKSEILGYGFITLAGDECQVINLAIKPEWQKQNLGTRLLKHMLSFAKEHGAQYSYLEVRTSNKNAQALYVKLGFTTMGVRKDYYSTHDGREDAIIMRADLKDF